MPPSSSGSLMGSCLIKGVRDVIKAMKLIIGGPSLKESCNQNYTAAELLDYGTKVRSLQDLMLPNIKCW